VKIALLSFDFGEYCIRLATALAREEDILLLLSHQEARSHEERLDQTVRFHPFTKPRYRQPLRQMRMIFKLIQAIRRFDPDVIHMQGGHMWFNLALPLLRRYPLILTIHDPRHHLGDRETQKQPQTIIDFGFRRATQIIVHGETMKQMVIDDLGISGDIIHVIPHIVLGDDTAQPQVQEEGSCLLFFGRIWEYKGLEYLIRAEPLITAQVPLAKIVIAGVGEDFTRYRRLMAHPERFIVYNEYVSNEKRTTLFRQASVVVLPYIEATQSGVIPLAYTFGKPVIATTVGSLPEMVEHGRTGYLVPPRDPAALANASICLLQNDALRHQLGANGKRKIITQCAPEVIAEQTLEVYYRAQTAGLLTQ